MRTLCSCFVVSCWLLAGTGAAAAQTLLFDSWGGTNLGTPDGVPPAQETICNGWQGDAHGLCAAYCEAMDCDSAAPHASEAACHQTAQRFTEITGEIPPCDCPCVGRIPNFLEALNGEFGLSLCVDVVLIPPDAAVLVLLVTDLGLVGSQTRFDIGACGFPAGSYLVITRAQAEKCNTLARQKAAEAGLACGAP
jgi:hypothetical protein